MSLLNTEATPVSAAASGCPGIPPRRTSKVRIGLEAHWLRETTGSVADPEFGAVFDTGFDAVVDVEPGPPGQVRARAASPMPGAVDGLVLFLLGIKSRGADVRQACVSRDAFQQLEQGRQRELETVFGPVRSAADYALVLEHVAAFIELRNRILRASLAALEWDYRGRAAADPEGEPPSRAWLPLHLPVMEKRTWNNRLTALPDCEVEAGAAGAVVVRPRGEQPADDYTLLRQTALALGANSAPASAGPAFHLSFSHEHTLHLHQLGLLLPPLLAAYGFSESQRAAAGSLPPDWRRIHVEFSLRVSGQAARAWLQTPKERSSPFNELFCDVSQTLQRSLRAWIPYIRCARPQVFSGKEELYALLVYQASRPFCQRQRPEFTYDPMNRSSVRQACWKTRAVMSGKLARVRKFLQARGWEEEALYFEPENLDAILSRVQSGSKIFLNLLGADYVAVERLRKLGAWCRDLQLSRGANPDEPARHLLRAAGEVNRVFRTRFNRLSTEGDLLNLGNLLLAVGTAAASEHFGQPAPIEVSVRLRNTAAECAGGEFVLRNTIRICEGGTGIIGTLP